MRDFYKYHFNSVTCENEMRPDAIIREIDGTNVTVDLSAADRILKFAEQNGIGVRGANLIGPEQTPDAMFAGTPEESDARIEHFIKGTFAQLRTDYPDLKLYAYDVCTNVLRQDGGGLRTRQQRFHRACVQNGQSIRAGELQAVPERLQRIHSG